ncbi:MAG: hypothetical protein M0D55_03360 [Elusimicrobiota bacterium]|nr:MAG: hypothetical protein M0D55_03360 [Elusimicrobiota bacterium]
MALSALLALLIAVPAFAQGPAEPQPVVDPAILRERADNLRDAVADMSVSNVSIKARAHGFFDALPREQIAVPVYRRRMDREPVRGELGSIEKMAEEADARIDRWKRTHKEPPPPSSRPSSPRPRFCRPASASTTIPRASSSRTRWACSPTCATGSPAASSSSTTA